MILVDGIVKFWPKLEDRMELAAFEKVLEEGSATPYVLSKMLEADFRRIFFILHVCFVILCIFDFLL